MKPYWVIGIMVLAIALVVGFAMMRPTGPTAAAFPPLAVDDHVRGATSSPVVLIEYLDFECEACGAYYPLVTTMEAEYGDRVTFVVRYFPLSGHRNGMSAALAAEAAAQQGKFWEMHDLLFSRQDEWGGKAAPTPAVFEDFAEELGLDMTKYRADVASAEVRARVERDMEGARAAGLNATPTFVLNGTQISAPRSEAAFRQIFDQALQAP